MIDKFSLHHPRRLHILAAFATSFDQNCYTLQVTKQWVWPIIKWAWSKISKACKYTIRRWDRKEGRSVEKTKRVTRTILVNRSRGRGGEGVIKCRVVHESLTPPSPLPSSLQSPLSQYFNTLVGLCPCDKVHICMCGREQWETVSTYPQVNIYYAPPSKQMLE